MNASPHPWLPTQALADRANLATLKKAVNGSGQRPPATERRLKVPSRACGILHEFDHEPHHGDEAYVLPDHNH